MLAQAVVLILSRQGANFSGSGANLSGSGERARAEKIPPPGPKGSNSSAPRAPRAAMICEKRNLEGPTRSL